MNLHHLLLAALTTCSHVALLLTRLSPFILGISISSITFAPFNSPQSRCLTLCFTLSGDLNLTSCGYPWERIHSSRSTAPLDVATGCRNNRRIGDIGVVRKRRVEEEKK
jgi:hypothetical protein